MDATAPAQAYPLTWPSGWRRTDPYRRISAKFNVGGSGNGRRLDLSDGSHRVRRELRAMGIPESVILISSDLRLRTDGTPYLNQSWSGLDPGVAVYWQDGKRRRCMAIDRYNRLPDNLGAIAATIESMRAIERHGGAEILDRAFTGFVALPAPEQWFTILGVSVHATRAHIEDAYRRLAMKHHPDRGGTQEEMARINAARDEGFVSARS